MESTARLLRLEEFAVARGISYQTARDSVRKQEVRSVRVGARGVRIPASELERLEREGTREPARAVSAA
jgi:excisionase family DNA binding protein